MGNELHYDKITNVEILEGRELLSKLFEGFKVENGSILHAEILQPPASIKMHDLVNASL